MYLLLRAVLISTAKILNMAVDLPVLNAHFNELITLVLFIFVFIFTFSFHLHEKLVLHKTAGETDMHTDFSSLLIRGKEIKCFPNLHPT